MKIKRVNVAEVQNAATLWDLLRAQEPFVVRGPVPDQPFATTLALLGSLKLKIWNQGNDFYHAFRQAVATAKGEDCPCSAFMDVGRIDARRLDTTDDFQATVPYLAPGTELNTIFLQPVLKTCFQSIEARARCTKLFTTMFTSRGAARGSVHGHNFDSFSQIVSAGEQTRVYLFPPDYYSRLGAKVMDVNHAGVSTLHNMKPEDDLLSEAFVHQPEPGDIVHTPFGWFHRFDHAGEYIDVATSWLFEDLVEDRLARVRSVMPAEDFEHLARQTRKLRHFWVLGPLAHINWVLTQKIAPLRRLLSGLSS